MNANNNPPTGTPPFLSPAATVATTATQGNAMTVATVSVDVRGKLPIISTAN
jgi:hypothetical protein